MKDRELKLYLEELGASATYQNRAVAVKSLADVLCPEPIETHFASEYRSSDGEREFESLWFFSDGYCMEAKKVLVHNQVDLLPLHHGVDYLEVTTNSDYQFAEAAGSDARFSLYFEVADSTGQFKASGSNCDKLQEVLMSYIQPGMKT